jgi:hypothetical protein
MRTLGFYVTILVLGPAFAWMVGWLAFPLMAFCAAYFWRPSWAWLSGFLSGAFTWTLLALAIDSYTEGIMGEKIAALFSLPPKSWMALFATGLVGGLANSFPAVSGKWLWKIREEQHQKQRYPRRSISMGRSSVRR